MKPVSLYNDIASTSYPGRGIVIGKSADGSKAVIAYFIMGRSENSRNRVFAETEDRFGFTTVHFIDDLYFGIKNSYQT